MKTLLEILKTASSSSAASPSLSMLYSSNPDDYQNNLCAAKEAGLLDLKEEDDGLNAFRLLQLTLYHILIHDIQEPLKDEKASFVIQQFILLNKIAQGFEEFMLELDFSASQQKKATTTKLIKELFEKRSLFKTEVLTNPDEGEWSYSDELLLQLSLLMIGHQPEDKQKIVYDSFSQLTQRALTIEEKKPHYDRVSLDYVQTVARNTGQDDVVEVIFTQKQVQPKKKKKSVSWPTPLKDIFDLKEEVTPTPIVITVDGKEYTAPDASTPDETERLEQSSSFSQTQQARQSGSVEDRFDQLRSGLWTDLSQEEQELIKKKDKELSKIASLFNQYLNHPSEALKKRLQALIKNLFELDMSSSLSAGFNSLTVGKNLLLSLFILTMSQLTSAEKEKAHEHLKEIIKNARITAAHQPNYDEVKDVFEKTDFSQVKKDKEQQAPSLLQSLWNMFFSQNTLIFSDPKNKESIDSKSSKKKKSVSWPTPLKEVFDLKEEVTSTPIVITVDGKKYTAPDASTPDETELLEQLRSLSQIQQARQSGSVEDRFDQLRSGLWTDLSQEEQKLIKKKDKELSKIASLFNQYLNHPSEALKKRLQALIKNLFELDMSSSLSAGFNSLTVGKNLLLSLFILTMPQLTSAEKEKAHEHLKDIIDTAGITADHQPNYDEVKDVFEKTDFSQVKKDLPSHSLKDTDNEDFDDEELDKDEVKVGISTQAKATHNSHDNSSVEAIRGDAEAKQHSVSSEARASVDFRSLVDHTAQFVEKHAHLTMMSDYDNNLINIKDQEKPSHNAYQVQMIDKDKITAVISSDYLHDSSKFDQHEAFMRHQIQYIESKNQRSVVTVSMDCQSEQDIKSLMATIKIVALSHSLEKDFHLNISFNPNIDLSASSTEKRFMDLVKDKDKIDIGTLKQLLSMSDYNPAAGYKPAV